MAKKPRGEPTRAPRQQRSRERVSQILDAAKALIAERGSAGLKIQDIADRAGVTAGSIYQYFPNKAAIIQELGLNYMAEVRSMLRGGLEQRAETLEAFVEMTRRLSRGYYDLQRHDPVIRDILLGTAVDKSLEDLDARDTQENTELLFEAAKQLLPEGSWPDARRLFYLSIELNTAMIRLALKAGPKEGPLLYEQAEEMLFLAFDARLRALAQGETLRP